MTILQQGSISPGLDDRPCSPDVLLGTYLVSHLRHFCENCGTLDTPQWRKGWHSEILNRSVLLCNACGLKYHKNQYCPYCRYVYGKEEEKMDAVWLTCQSCGRWVHIDCEKKCGMGLLLEEKESVTNSDFRHVAGAPSYHYSCPNCRRDSNARSFDFIQSFSNINKNATYLFTHTKETVSNHGPSTAASTSSESAQAPVAAVVKMEFDSRVASTTPMQTD